MEEKPLDKNTFYVRLNLKGVSSEEGIRGYVRIKGIYRVHRFSGFMVPFTHNEQASHFKRDEVFWYGNEDHLWKLYGGLPNPGDALLHMLPEDNPLLSQTYYRFPLEHTPLNRRERASLDEFVNIAEEKFPVYVKTLSPVTYRVDAEQDEELFHKLSDQLEIFPLDILETAMGKGEFYSAIVELTKKNASRSLKPRTRIIYTPMGGLPEWAKPYVKQI